MYSSGRSCVGAPLMRTSWVTGSSSIGPTFRTAARIAGGRARAPLGEPVRERGHAQHDLAHDERLHDVVIGADLEAEDAILGLALRGQHQHADVGDLRVGADRLADVVAGLVGQHQVEHDDVGLVLLHGGEPLGPRRAARDLEAGARAS